MLWVAPSEKDAPTDALEKRLWDAADQFRANSGLKAQEYSAPVLGLIFLRFAEVRFAARRAELEEAGASGRRGSRIDEPAAYHADGILYLPAEAQFDYLLNRPEAENIGAKVNAAMRDIEKHISGVMSQVREVLDASITGVEMPASPAPVMDLSRIDFEALAKRFKLSKTRNTHLEVLKAAIRVHMERLIRLNRTRADYQGRFEELIESYNSGSRSIEELFEKLLKFTRSLSEEQQRHIRENVSEEELVIFDILTRPAPDLGPEERAQVKRVARDLLARLKDLLVLNWRRKSSARSQLRLAIEDVLDTGLPRVYEKPLYEQKCSAVFEHMFENYPERDRSVYAAAG